MRVIHVNLNLNLHVKLFGTHKDYSLDASATETIKVVMESVKPYVCLQNNPIGSQIYN